MNDIAFQVSAKTARLIGRENISDVDGAIVELVKNGYDADAECVYVRYDMPYVSIPREITFTEVKQNFPDNQNQLKKYYNIKNGVYVLKDNLVNDDLDMLQTLLLSVSSILVLDNGSGMTNDILQTTWMNIGTDDKEVNIKSKRKNRIKTGAKGIGRFALDKLSLKSSVITKNETDSLRKWEIDWRQFDDAKLLNQVKANIFPLQGDFNSVVKDLVGEDFSSINSYDWSSGTAILLSPVRELWSEKSYRKVNSNLKNINPLGHVDKFDVIVKSINFPKYNFKTEDEGISRDSYDYMITAKYDGNNKVVITYDRNEIDINVKNITKKYSETDKEIYDLDEFWSKPIFQKDKYKRIDFNGNVEFEYSLKEIISKLKDDELHEYLNVGEFELKIYYLKNTKSKVEIIRDFKVRERRKMLKNYSGIKIYRDDFKVRPYGDEGIFYDWIDLSKRVQNSPAAASHETGLWRVSPNQVIGSISISRITNSKLEDTANREGMSLNSEYNAFVKIIQGIITKFEYDRQYPLREYALWYKEKENAHKTQVQKIYEEVMREKEIEKQKQKKAEDEIQMTDDSNELEEQHEPKKLPSDNSKYSEADLKDVIYSIGQKKEYDMTVEKLLMLLSSAGVMAQTFAHEISRIATNLGSRGQHLEESIKLLLNHQAYLGDEDFNPFDMLDELNSTDILLSEWVNLIMESVNKENFYTQKVVIYDFLVHIKEKWKKLLERKHIQLEIIKESEDIILSLPIVDLHLIVNNFLLNSAYFLEECSGERIISLKVYKKEKVIYLDMENNGPKLADDYSQNPDEIFNAQISSKTDGTGLGLWVANQAAIRNDGRLEVEPINSGFKIKASWKE